MRFRKFLLGNNIPEWAQHEVAYEELVAALQPIRNGSATRAEVDAFFQFLETDLDRVSEFLRSQESFLVRQWEATPSAPVGPLSETYRDEIASRYVELRCLVKFARLNALAYHHLVSKLFNVPKEQTQRPSSAVIARLRNLLEEKVSTSDAFTLRATFAALEAMARFVEKNPTLRSWLLGQAPTSATDPSAAPGSASPSEGPGAVGGLQPTLSDAEVAAARRDIAEALVYPPGMTAVPGLENSRSGGASPGAPVVPADGLPVVGPNGTPISAGIQPGAVVSGTAGGVPVVAGADAGAGAGAASLAAMVGAGDADADMESAEVLELQWLMDPHSRPRLMPTAHGVFFGRMSDPDLMDEEPSVSPHGAGGDGTGGAADASAVDSGSRGEAGAASKAGGVSGAKSVSSAPTEVIQPHLSGVTSGGPRSGSGASGAAEAERPAGAQESAEWMLRAGLAVSTVGRGSRHATASGGGDAAAGGAGGRRGSVAAEASATTVAVSARSGDGTFEPPLTSSADARERELATSRRHMRKFLDSQKAEQELMRSQSSMEVDPSRDSGVSEGVCDQSADTCDGSSTCAHPLVAPSPPTTPFADQGGWGTSSGIRRPSKRLTREPGSSSLTSPVEVVSGGANVGADEEGRSAPPARGYIETEGSLTDHQRAAHLLKEFDAADDVAWLVGLDGPSRACPPSAEAIAAAPLSASASGTSGVTGLSASLSGAGSRGASLGISLSASHSQRGVPSPSAHGGALTPSVGFGGVDTPLRSPARILSARAQSASRGAPRRALELSLSSVPIAGSGGSEPSQLQSRAHRAATAGAGDRPGGDGSGPRSGAGSGTVPGDRARRNSEDLLLDVTPPVGGRRALTHVPGSRDRPTSSGVGENGGDSGAATPRLEGRVPEENGARDSRPASSTPVPAAAGGGDAAAGGRAPMMTPTRERAQWDDEEYAGSVGCAGGLFRCRLFSGSVSNELAKDVAHSLGRKRPNASDVGQFSNGEVHVRISQPLMGDDCFLLQSICGRRAPIRPVKSPAGAGGRPAPIPISVRGNGGGAEAASAAPMVSVPGGLGPRAGSVGDVAVGRTPTEAMPIHRCEICEERGWMPGGYAGQCDCEKIAAAEAEAAARQADEGGEGDERAARSSDPADPSAPPSGGAAGGPLSPGPTGASPTPWKTDVNTALMEVFLMCQSMKLAGARRITLVTPYLGYTRSDMKGKLQMPIAASAVASMIERMGVRTVITMDVHSEQVDGFFSKAVFVNIPSRPVFVRWFSDFFAMRSRKLAARERREVAAASQATMHHKIEAAAVGGGGGAVKPPRRGVMSLSMSQGDQTGAKDTDSHVVPTAPVAGPSALDSGWVQHELMRSICVVAPDSRSILVARQFADAIACPSLVSIQRANTLPHAAAATPRGNSLSPTGPGPTAQRGNGTFMSPCAAAAGGWTASSPAPTPTAPSAPACEPGATGHGGLSASRGPGGACTFRDARGREVMVTGAIRPIALVIDDIIDTAVSVCEVATVLRAAGCERVIALATHGLFSSDALQRIEACSALREVVVTDSVPQDDTLQRSSKVTVLPVGGLLAEAIRRLHSDQSLSTLLTINDGVLTDRELRSNTPTSQQNSPRRPLPIARAAPRLSTRSPPVSPVIPIQPGA